jgi:hypothetical protein
MSDIRKGATIATLCPRGSGFWKRESENLSVVPFPRITSSIYYKKQGTRDSSDHQIDQADVEKQIGRGAAGKDDSYGVPGNVQSETNRY